MVEISWAKLPALPDPEGFGGMYAGVSGTTLVAAGGANFPERKPWEGGKKVWTDAIYLLDAPEGAWRVAKQKLPRPLGYGVSVTWRDAVICVGGADLDRHYDDAFALRRNPGSSASDGGELVIETLPSLPHPCANMCGSLVGSTLYIAGGTQSPGATEALRNFWALDLDQPAGKRAWRVLEPWPGEDRSHAVAATVGDSFYMVCGFRWRKGSDGKPERLVPFQHDAFRYTPDANGAGTWQRLADVPFSVGGAPTPAMSIGQSKFAIAGGVDEAMGALEPASHPGFGQEVLCYDAVANTWSAINNMPAGSRRVTAPTTVWNDQYVILSGERAPGRRSADVYAARSFDKRKQQDRATNSQ